MSEPTAKRSKGLKFRNYNPTQEELKETEGLEKIEKPKVPDIEKQVQEEIAKAAEPSADADEVGSTRAFSSAVSAHTPPSRLTSCRSCPKSPTGI